MNGFFEEINRLTLEGSEWCTLGRFCRAFLEKDPVITQKIIPHIEKSVNCHNFHSKVMRMNFMWVLPSWWLNMEISFLKWC